MGEAKARMQAFAAVDQRVSGRMRKALSAALGAFYAGDQVDALSVVATINGRVYTLSRGPSVLVHRALGIAQEGVQQQALQWLRFELPAEAAEQQAQASEQRQEASIEDPGQPPADAPVEGPNEGA